MTLAQFFLLIAYPLAVGLGLGFLYYGGLWLILRSLTRLKHPAAWMGFSLVVRTLVVLLVLYLLFRESWQQLLFAVAGMLVARFLLVRRIRPARRLSDAANQEVP